MIWFTLVCYILATYGITFMVTESYGPLNIFVHLRNIAYSIHENLGRLFSCPLCFGTNLGWMLSVINWFFLPVAITPFNIILDGTDLWWLALLLDAGLTGACTYTLYLIDDYIDAKTPKFDDEEYGEE